MQSAGELCVVEDADALRDAALELVLDRAQRSIQARGAFHVAVSGGGTPRALYRALPERCADFSGWHVHACDERCVPPDDPQSNFRQVREAWLERARIPPSGVHRMRGEIEPELSAREYERELREQLGDPPRLDLALMGIGTDGHTASLFPASSALAERSRLVLAVRAAAEPPQRITLTLPALELSRETVFLVAGAEKAPALRAALAPEPGAKPSPARIVGQRGARVLWLADRAAAALLPRSA
jgi:6-phosphogluconolactonase